MPPLPRNKNATILRPRVASKGTKVKNKNMNSWMLTILANLDVFFYGTWSHNKLNWKNLARFPCFVESAPAKNSQPPGNGIHMIFIHNLEPPKNTLGKIGCRKKWRNWRNKILPSISVPFSDAAKVFHVVFEKNSNIHHFLMEFNMSACSGL